MPIGKQITNIDHHYETQAHSVCVFIYIQNKQGFFDPDVVQWIGFTYRMLYIETKIPSAELCNIVSFDAMCGYYPGLHTLDEEMAIDIICENFNLAFDEESLAEGKRIERMVEDGSIYPLLEEMEQQMREEKRTGRILLTPTHFCGIF